MIKDQDIPEISVVIPMYNSSSTIIKAIHSVLGQDYIGKIEILIIDDGSIDTSVEVVENYVASNSLQNVVLIKKENGGVSSARNIGLINSKGRYIALLDSDDEWNSGKLSKQMNVLQSNPDIDFVACNPIQDKINTFFFKRFQYLNVIDVKDLIFKNYFQPSTVMFKRKIIEDIGLFDENQRYAEEGNYFLRIAHKYKCVLMNERLINYGGGKAGFGDSGLSSNLVEMEKGELKNLKFAFDHKYINLFVYVNAVVFSLSKYIVRLTKVWIRKK